LGFIGSSLVIRLVELGAQVTVVDAKLRGCGANEHNIRPVRGDVGLLVKDIAVAQIRFVTERRATCPWRKTTPCIRSTSTGFTSIAP